MKTTLTAIRMGLLPASAILAGLALVVSAAHAEKADKDKPTEIESNRMSSDDARGISIFEGNVVLTKGTILVHADRITVREDPDGFQISTATGDPAHFRQKREGKEEWIEGEALRIVIDDHKEKIELFDKAQVNRDKDVVRGDAISVDTRSEYFTVTAGKSVVTGTNPEGRVRAVIQPKAKPDAPAATVAPKKPGG